MNGLRAGPPRSRVAFAACSLCGLTLLSVQGAFACAQPQPIKPAPPCPQQPVAGVPPAPEEERVLFFMAGQSAVTASDAFFALGYVAALLDHNQKLEVLIVGHADGTGPADWNRSMSLKRASSVRAVLVSKGIAQSRIAIAAPRELSAKASDAVSRRAELYIYEPPRESVIKKLGYEVDVRAEDAAFP